MSPPNFASSLCLFFQKLHQNRRSSLTSKQLTSGYLYSVTRMTAKWLCWLFILCGKSQNLNWWKYYLRLISILFRFCCINKISSMLRKCDKKINIFLTANIVEKNVFFASSFLHKYDNIYLFRSLVSSILLAMSCLHNKEIGPLKINH